MCLTGKKYSILDLFLLTPLRCPIPANALLLSRRIPVLSPLVLMKWDEVTDHVTGKEITMIFFQVFPPCALELRHGNSFGHVEEMAQTSIRGRGGRLSVGHESK